MARIEKINKSKRMREQFGENKFMLKKKHKGMMMSPKEMMMKMRKRGFKKKHKITYQKPKPQGRGIVRALGQKGTTGNFKRIEASKGKGAAIAALQNKLAKRRGQPIPFHRKGKK